jgi:hypothetical protein
MMLYATLDFKNLTDPAPDSVRAAGAVAGQAHDALPDANRFNN